MPIFFSSKGSTVEIKNGGHSICFCGRAAESAHQMHFLRFLREDWGEFQSRMYVKGGRKYQKIRFYRIYIEISHLGHNVIKKAFKWKSKWISTNIHYRGSPWGSRTQQHAYCLRYAHSHHIESHLGKKQPQAKIAIAFLFGQLHFNNITSHALFYGGHLVMCSKRCAVQN